MPPLLSMGVSVGVSVSFERGLSRFGRSQIQVAGLRHAAS